MDKYRLIIDSFNGCAQAYQDKFMDITLYNDTYDAFCNLIGQKGASVFEIGCGPGNITKYLLEKRPDLKIKASDLAPKMIDLARKNIPVAAFEVMDCREIASVKEKFDAVMCGFCMPYLSKIECAKMISDCSHLLKPGGIFYFSVIEDVYNRSGYVVNKDGTKTFYVYYHEEGYLREALKENGFDVMEVVRKKYPLDDNSIDTHLIIIARKLL